MSPTSEHEEISLEKVIKDLKISHDTFVAEQKMRNPTMDGILVFTKQSSDRMVKIEKLLEDLINKIVMLERRL